MVVLQHHESQDGDGYLGLEGDEIHIGARIITIADSFDAMTSDRAYRKRYSWDWALDDLRINSIMKKKPSYDPEVFFSFEAGLRSELGSKKRTIIDTALDTLAPGLYALYKDMAMDKLK